MNRPPLLAGVDVSSHIIAIALIDARNADLYETLELRIKPGGDNPAMPMATAFRLAADTLSWANAIWIENPMGAHPKSIATGNRAIGALLREIGGLDPVPPVNLIVPPTWKKLAGLKGNAPKPVISTRALDLYPTLAGPDYSQDICDAACIAYAGYAESLAAADRLARNA